MPTRDEFDDARKVACGCAEGAALLRQVWDSANKDATQSVAFAEPLADNLVRLAYHVKRSRSLSPIVLQEIRALRKKRPKPVAGIDAESYHDQATKLADDTVWKTSTAFWLGREILEVVDGSDIPKAQLQKSLNDRRESVVAKIRQVLSNPHWREGPRLNEGLPPFNGDTLIVSINKESALAIKQSDEVPPPPPRPPKLPTRPPDKAFQAWQIRELLHISNQKEIAEKMTEQGTPASQGQVSKWLKAVEKWRTAGGLMPEVGTLNSEPQSVDPDILDMGARQDGLTPRQRPRRDSDADE